MQIGKMAFLACIALNVSVFAQVDTGHYYLMTYFKNSYQPLNDMSGVFFATSTDGMNWVELNNGQPVIQGSPIPDQQCRDPMSYYDAPTMTFHLVYGTGWTTKTIGYTSITIANGKNFKDPKNWTPQVGIPVSDSIAGAVCSWAPEIFYDDILDKFMLFWSTDTGGNVKRTYYVLTSDFITFTRPEKLFDPGFTEIDATILKVAEAKYYMFFKDERDATKKIYYTVGTTPQGPWGAITGPITSTSLTGVQGPTALKFGNEYRVYFDPYNVRQNYHMIKSTDLVTWTDGGMISAGAINFYYSHCSIMEIPKNIYDWINTGTFATPVKPAIPALSSPANNSTNLGTTSINLVWGASANATAYEVQVSTYPDFSITTIALTMTGTSLTADSLLTDGTPYYWRVRAKNATDASSWSAAWTFSILAAPVPASPTTGSVNIPLSTVLGWNSVRGAVTYRVQVSTDSDFSTLIIDDSTVSANTKTLDSLIPNTLYYWRVNAKYTGKTSVWSAPSNFTTIPNSPGTPLLVSPTTGVLDQPVSVSLVWHSVQTAVSYQVLVAEKADFNALLIDSSGVTDTTLIISGLLNDTKYYWCVRATNGGGTSGWSITGNFTTIPGLPAAVVTVFPPDTATIITDSVQIVWQKGTPEIVKYMLQIATDSAMSHLLVEDSTLTDTTMVVSELDQGVAYWWRVKAQNAAGWGPYSNKAKFSCATTAVLSERKQCTSFSCSGSLKVLHYSLPRQCFVSLKYYDVLGKQVASFINQTQNAGRYTLHLPISTWAQGTYIQVFYAERFVNKDMIVVAR